MITKLIKLFYLLSLILLPLIFTSFNSELFEVPKIFFFYFTTVLIAYLHTLNWLNGSSPLLPKPKYLLTALFLYLAALSLTTYFSIDLTTSLFGFPSRPWGGLYSQIAIVVYVLILTLYLNGQFSLQLINALVVSSFLTSIYACLQKLGIDKHVWAQDVQSRVFSTLGQPNWLGAFLVAVIPLIYQLYSQSRLLIYKIFYLVIFLTELSALIFTGSQSSLIAFTVTCIPLMLITLIKSSHRRPGFIILTASIFLLLSIPNPLIDKLIPRQTPPLLANPNTPSQNITASGDIRLIVWQGAIELFRRFPLFGTGLETFAYSYYWTRPATHNLTSEWDFLYNKAHNEYLNFLATTGLVGTTAYFLLILAFLIILIRSKSPYRLPLMAGFLSLLITNFFGFSVTSTGMLFFLIPILGLIPSPTSPQNPLNRKWLFLPVFTLIFIYIFLKLINFYTADYFYAKSIKNQNNLISAYTSIQTAIGLRPNFVPALSQSALISSQLAVSLKATDPQSSDKYLTQAIASADKAAVLSPASTNLLKERAQTFFYLSRLEPKYLADSIKALQKVVALAPTDAKTFYTLGQFLEVAHNPTDAEKYYLQAYNLKANYDHDLFALGQLYARQKQYDLSRQFLDKTLKLIPQHPDAQKLLKSLPSP